MTSAAILPQPVSIPAFLCGVSGVPWGHADSSSGNHAAIGKGKRTSTLLQPVAYAIEPLFIGYGSASGAVTNTQAREYWRAGGQFEQRGALVEGALNPPLV